MYEPVMSIIKQGPELHRVQCFMMHRGAFASSKHIPNIILYIIYSKCFLHRLQRIAAF